MKNQICLYKQYIYIYFTSFLDTNSKQVNKKGPLSAGYSFQATISQDAPIQPRYDCALIFVQLDVCRPSSWTLDAGLYRALHRQYLSQTRGYCGMCASEESFPKLSDFGRNPKP